MPKCPNDHVVEDGQKFCPTCGASIPEQVEAQPPDTIDASQTDTTSSRKKRRVAIAVGIGLVAVLIAGVVTALTLSGGSTANNSAFCDSASNLGVASGVMYDASDADAGSLREAASEAQSSATQLKQTSPSGSRADFALLAQALSEKASVLAQVGYNQNRLSRSDSQSISGLSEDAYQAGKRLTVVVQAKCKQSFDFAPSEPPVASYKGVTTTTTSSLVQDQVSTTTVVSSANTIEPCVPPDCRYVSIERQASIVASSTAPPNSDASGNPVTYDASNALDGYPETAWRTSGDGVGQTLTLTWPHLIGIDTVGIIPGYDKTDPQDGTNRFAQDRRVTSARLTLDDGSSVNASFTDSPTMQLTTVGKMTKTLTITILSSSSAPLDYTAISDIQVEGTP